MEEVESHRHGGNETRTYSLMRQILIVGAGPAGMLLALGLQSRGYVVHVITDRSVAEVRNGPILSTQCTFSSALASEHRLGGKAWANKAPPIESLGVSVLDEDGRRAIDWMGKLDGVAQSIDQRLKVTQWMDVFVELGGHLEVRRVLPDELSRLSSHYELTIVASGRGDLSNIFPRNEGRSIFNSPQRELAACYVKGLSSRDNQAAEAIHCNILPGLGEFFVMPCLTEHGRCDILFWEAIPGGPLDVFKEISGAQEHLDTTLALMEKFVPWEYERAKGVALSDSSAVLTGRVSPGVRDAVANLSGQLVLGMADAVVTNDPIAGQGGNLAALCAETYLSAIVEQGNRPFDEAFMRKAFERYWAYAEHAYRWSSALLAPPPAHVLELLATASSLPTVADRFANGFNDPSDFDDWLYDAEKAEDFIDREIAFNDGGSVTSEFS